MKFRRIFLFAVLSGIFLLPANTPAALPNTIYEVTDGGQHLWLSTGCGLIDFDKQTGTWTLHELPQVNAADDPQVWTSCVNPDGSLFVGTMNCGFYRFADGEWSRTDIPSREDMTYFRKARYGPDSTLWVTDLNTLYHRDGNGDWRSYPVFGDGYSEANKNIVFQTDGTPWVLSTYGISKLDGDSITTVFTSFLSLDKYFDIAADSLGWIWTTSQNIETFETTLVKTNGTDIVTVGTPPGIMYSLAFDRHGTLWGGDSNKVGSFDGATWTVYDSTDCAHLANDIILDLLAEDDGTLWVGMKYNGLLKFDGAAWTHYDIDPETVGVEEASPSGFALSPAFPNPFNPATTIGFTLPESGRVTITVHDIAGRKVAVLMDDLAEAGRHEVVFDGAGLASGVYFCRIQAGGTVKTGKMLLIK